MGAQYKAAAQAARQAILDAWRDGRLQGHIDALSEPEAVDPAQCRDEPGEVLDYLRQIEMMAASGGQPVTDEQIRDAHEVSVAEQTYHTETPADQTEWASFSPQTKARWRARAQAAITRFTCPP